MKGIRVIIRRFSSLVNSHNVTQRHDKVVSASVTYSGGTVFEPFAGDQLSLEIFQGLPSYFQTHVTVSNRFRPYAFDFHHNVGLLSFHANKDRKSHYISKIQSASLVHVRQRKQPCSYAQLSTTPSRRRATGEWKYSSMRS
jgi:hypothetical protein